jgi:small subunit ribosomal protein S20e
MSTETPQTTQPSISKKVGLEVSEKKTIHKIRLTLLSRDVKALEKVCADLISETKKKNIKVAGPVRLPTKIYKPLQMT